MLYFKLNIMKLKIQILFLLNSSKALSVVKLNEGQQ